MAVPGAALARAVAALATNKKLQRGIGWFLVAIFSPLILLIAFLCSLGDGTAEHNNAAVDLSFSGGPIPDTMPDDYAGYIQDMQSCLTTLDGAIAEINRHMLFGSLDGALIKSTYKKFKEIILDGVELNPECLVAEDIFWHETEYRSNFNVKPMALHHKAGPEA